MSNSHETFVKKNRWFSEGAIVESVAERMLSVRMVGALENQRVWAALRFVVSLMLDVSKDWSGALWSAWVKCAVHPQQCLDLATPNGVRAH